MFPKIEVYPGENEEFGKYRDYLWGALFEGNGRNIVRICSVAGLRQPDIHSHLSCMSAWEELGLVNGDSFGGYLSSVQCGVRCKAGIGWVGFLRGITAYRIMIVE